ncbi:MAG: glycoside hydrolase family 3 C-terminal domain-containing protein [Clostridia bacterium]|nr:glycoside hydrolase family 3 C-terminal domain-containing protein [Clostridia bacterium]
MNSKRTFYPGQTDLQVSPREAFGRALSRRAAAQGMVLLENDGTLPLKPGARLALFGIGARHTIKGGTGSGDVNSRDTVSVEAGLRAAGFDIVNAAWLDEFDAAYDRARAAWQDAIYAEAGPERDFMKMYLAHARLSPELPEALPMPRAACEAADAIVYVLSRNSGEGLDRRDAPGDYYLSDAERRELAGLCAVGRPVAVLLNTGGIIDLGFMDELPIAALVLMSQAGAEGGSAVADLLSGKVNFSGRLTDTWARRYEDYPSSAGFSHRNGNTIEEYYEDGIFVGYRYFDTFSVEPRYPFGYGLSYTTFTRALKGVRVEGAQICADVEVVNTGAVPGRQVVQLYASCPDAGQPMELKRLVAFGKTGTLNPGAAETLSLRFDLEALASWRAGHAAWFMQAGDYILMPGFDARDARPEYRLRLGKTVPVRQLSNVCELLDALRELKPDGAARAALEAQAADLPVIAVDGAAEALARANARPAAPAGEPEDRAMQIARQMTDEEKARLVVGASRDQSNDEIGGAARSVPGAAGETAAFPNHGVPGMVLADGPAGLRLQQRYEIEPDSGRIYALSRFEVMENRFFGKLALHAGAESRYQFATAIPVGTLLAQSFDPALLEEVGDMIAGEMRAFGVAVWLAPGMNIHRNPLCGRNFEYYSEDPLISGLMAAAITRGVQRAPGVGVCIKHYACNNQEDNRFHVTAVISERALREIYLKGFEIAVKTARPASIMTSYNRVNGVHAANSRDLCTTVARQEWGFDGFIMTDWTTTNGGHGSSAAKCIRAGNDLVMPGAPSDRREILEALRGENGQFLPRQALDASAARIIRAALSAHDPLSSGA